MDSTVLFRFGYLEVCKVIKWHLIIVIEIIIASLFVPIA